MSLYDFDLSFFQQRFSSRPTVGDRTKLSYICSPPSLVDLEYYRALLQEDLAGRERYPCDVFAWAKGPAPDRDQTLLGGLPYRPAKMPWPLDRQSQPMLFLGQVRFVESRDIVPDLPGDLLLLFVDQVETPGDWTKESFMVEWHDLGLRGLARAEDVPIQSRRIPNWYGVRHRTFDVAGPLNVDLIEPLIPEWNRRNAEDAETWSWELARLHIAKIGGRLPHAFEGHLDLSTAPLFSMPALSPSFWAPYPLVNHPEPFVGNEIWDECFSPGEVCIAILWEARMHPEVHVSIFYC